MRRYTGTVARAHEGRLKRGGSMSKSPTCHDCRYLFYESHGASGGGSYRCGRWRGVVLSDTGWWETGDTEPRPLQEDCYEPKEGVIVSLAWLVEIESRVRTDVPRLCQAVRELSTSLSELIRLCDDADHAADPASAARARTLLREMKEGARAVLERWERGGGPVPESPGESGGDGPTGAPGPASARG